MLDDLVDESDPDVDFPNSFHAFQTAEGIRKAHPDKDWFHLVGLLHDLGKILALWGEPQVKGRCGEWGSISTGLGARCVEETSPAAACAFPVGCCWRHFPSGLPSPGLCGVL